MLFLAISSMLALVAFTGLGPRLRNTRFTDATRSLQSDIVREMSDAQVGVNSRIEGSSCKEGTIAGAAAPVFANASEDLGGCVVNGRLVELSNTQATYYAVISLRTPEKSKNVDDCKGDSLDIIIDCFKPIIVTGSEIEPRIRLYKNGMQATPDVRFGYIQSPNSNNKHYFFYNVSPRTTQVLSTGLNGTVDADLTATACATLSLGDRRSSLEFNTNSLRPELKIKGCS